MLIAFIVGGFSSLANAHAVANQNMGLAAHQAIMIMDTKVMIDKSAPDIVAKAGTSTISVYYTENRINKNHRNKGCEKSCEQTCPPSTCMNGILLRDTFNLRNSNAFGRLPFYAMQSDHIASTQPLFHPPKV